MDADRGFAPATTAEPTSPRRNRRDRLALRAADFLDSRYADVAGQHLARTLTAEDQSEEDGLDCPSCGDTPATRATRQLVRASLAVAHDC
ncbi:hypothetical protein ACWED2_12425 [Amycolatopsis sp. NPDC005003]